MIYKKNNIYTFSLLEQFPHIKHGFTTKKHGNMQVESTRKDFFASIGVSYTDVVLQEQVHGVAIHEVLPADHGTTVTGVDGLVYQKNENTPIYLSVHVGDCAALLFFDPVKEVIGVAHSGWKGTAGHIASEMVKKFQKFGSLPEDIVIVCGPCICCDCYPTNLWKSISSDLREQKVQKYHMDYDKTLCTFENKEEFYSWRRKDEPFGEIMGYIGYTDVI